MVRGYLHLPEGGTFERGIVLAHGAGSNANAPLLVLAARYFAERGWAALRVDLPFRQARPKGPPYPAMAARDREGLKEAIALLQTKGGNGFVLSGHSYGGRQASMLAAEDPTVADVLLLFSYPLHPPGKPETLRTAHFLTLRTPAVFVHGSRDPFGTLEEMRTALATVPGSTVLVESAGSGHELRKVNWQEVYERVEGALKSTR
jgi:predicted alpha/beta-hydrolase family hydrolase